MAEFNLAALLKNVPKMDTGSDGREQIEYIELDKIDPDPRNFYELSGLDELAANIELLGLQQPLRVRDNPELDGHVIIVSGHRRRAALKMLVDDGKTEFARVPCIREHQTGSDALQELRLIYANSDTRRMTSAETAKQVERVEALLYQLKEEGVEFPGRMRDHVAEACKVSKSKIARLKVIRDRLEPGIYKKYESGELKESVAYAFAQQTPEMQREAYDRLCIGKTGCARVTESVVENYVDLARSMRHQCPVTGSVCSNAERMIDKAYNDKGYVWCKYQEAACCKTCPYITQCSASCVLCSDRKNKLKTKRKNELAAEKAKRQKTEADDVRELKMLWARFAAARKAAGKGYEDIRKDLNLYEFTNLSLKYEAGDLKPGAMLPFGYGITLSNIRRLKTLAEYLGCSVSYLLCESDDPTEGGHGH